MPCVFSNHSPQIPPHGPNPDYGCFAHSQIGEIQRQLGLYDDAAKHLQTAIRQAEELAAIDSNDAPIRRELGVAYRRLADLLGERNRWNEARVAAEKAVDIQMTLVRRFPDDSHVLSDTGQALNSLALVEMRAKQWESAAGLLRRAIDQQQAALKLTYGLLDFKLHLCRHYMNLTDCLQQGQVGKRDDLEQACRASVYWAEQILRDEPERFVHKWNLAEYSRTLAVLLAESPVQLAEAIEAANKAVAAYEALAKAFPNVPAYGHECGHALGRLADLWKARGQWADARKCYEQAIKRLETSTGGVPQGGTYLRCLATAENNLAWFLVACPDVPSRDPQLALQRAQNAVDHDRGVGGHWHTLGVAYYRNERYDDAILALKKAMEMKKGATELDLFCLAMVHWQTRDYEKARSWYDEAVRRMEEDAADDAEIIRFRDEAAELLGKRTDRE